MANHMEDQQKQGKLPSQVWAASSFSQEPPAPPLELVGLQSVLNYFIVLRDWPKLAVNEARIGEFHIFIRRRKFHHLMNFTVNEL